jgi:hypothetical protein
MSERPTRRDFLQAAVVAGASLALPGVLAPSSANGVSPASAKTLEELPVELAKVFGRFTNWRLRTVPTCQGLGEPVKSPQARNRITAQNGQT